MKDKFVVAGIQINLGKSPDENLEKAVNWTENAAKQGAEIICLPELYRSQYFCQEEKYSNFDLAETIPGPSTNVFQKVAKEFNVVVIVPVFEKRSLGLFHNSLVMIDAGGEMLGIYRKMHIPDDPAYYEKYYFAPGDLGFKTFNTKLGKVGALICWDQWYPEAARITALNGAAVLFYPTAIGWHPSEKEKYGTEQKESWMTIQRSHAIANGVYVASINRTGFEKPVELQEGIEFWGSSFICDPQGVIISQAAADKEEIVMAEVDLEHLETVRRNWPFLRDRRIDAYDDIKKRFIDDK
jgi:N-carbamoylputrescine amidase